MTQVHDACMLTSESGRVFTVWGDPAMSVAFVMENNGLGVVESGGSVEGSVRWVTEGRRGSCRAVFSFSGRQEGQEVAAGTMEGTVCNHSFSRSFSFG